MIQFSAGTKLLASPIGLPSASRPGLGRSFLDFDISEEPLGTSLSLHLIELSTGFNSA
jgi:hypothetical protein